MRERGFTPEQIIGFLRRAGVELAQGRTVGEVCRGLGASEASFYRWRSECGGLEVDRARRMKDLEREDARLKKAVAELTLDKQIPKEAAEGSSDASACGRAGRGTCGPTASCRTTRTTGGPSAC